MFGTGFKRSDGTVSHLSWQLHWKWRGDVHHFTVRPSLGAHYNVSEQSRRERELNYGFDLDDDDLEPVPQPPPIEYRGGDFA